MPVITDSSNDRFRISMLIYDTRYRSMTIQIVTLACFIFGLGWLINNAATNLEALGKPLGFDFLSNAAGYDINQRLIEYNNQMSHGRATIVGLLNTLLVAVLGCFIATIVGVTVGVLRLSDNWIVARIMTVYIETVRNVPVLLWIVLAMAVFINSLPAPSEFRGIDATASMIFGDSVAFTNRGIYVPSLEFSSGSTMVFITFFASLLGIWFFTRWSKARQELTGHILPNFRIQLGILFIPTFLIFFILGQPIGLDYPSISGFNFQGGLFLRNSLIALTLALSLYTASYIAENVRAGIMAVSKGQFEAAAALGLRPAKTMKLVVLPQALRIIIPPMISHYLNLTKNSSLAIVVGYMDITGTLGGITLNQTGREMECLLILMAVYLSISISISTLMNWYNQSVKLKER